MIERERPVDPGSSGIILTVKGLLRHRDGPEPRELDGLRADEVKIVDDPTEGVHPGVVVHSTDRDGYPQVTSFGYAEFDTSSSGPNGAFAIRILKRVKDEAGEHRFVAAGVITGAAVAIAAFGAARRHGHKE